MRKIYEHEGEFLSLFHKAVATIVIKADEDDPMTLREVLEFGFNSVCLNDHVGYEPGDFSEKLLDTKVEYDCWDYDGDGYRRVYLEEVD